MWVRGSWTATASALHGLSTRNYDGQSLTFTGGVWVPSATQPTQRDERPFDPRLGITRKLTQHWALSASGFRAFRSPSPYELYRTTTVGSQTTRPNGTLLSERATGWEAGVATQHPWGTVRASYFLTEVNRPIVAVTNTPTLLTRENLGQIESRGISLDYELAPLEVALSRRGIPVRACSCMREAHRTCCNWIPEVARTYGYTLNLLAPTSRRVGTLSLQSRLSGRMIFDDDLNTSNLLPARLLSGSMRTPRINSARALKSLAPAKISSIAAIGVSNTPATAAGQRLRPQLWDSRARARTMEFSCIWSRQSR